jgi:hypothetical protein
MANVRKADWERVVADGYRVPHGVELDVLTIELVAMLGDPDPRVRDDLAFSVLDTWISEGVYDDLLAGLGDGLAHGLRDRIGEVGTASVLRRSLSAVALASVIARDNATHGLHPSVILTWADRAVSWFLAERDLRTELPDAGWSSPLSHGADLLGALTASRYLGADELSVLLDVIAERLTTVTEFRFSTAETDRLAFATMSLLHRELVPVDRIEAWTDGLGHAFIAATAGRAPGQPVETPAQANTMSFIRALQLQLLLGVGPTPAQNASGREPRPPASRGDLLIAVQRAIRTATPWLYRAP